MVSNFSLAASFSNTVNTIEGNCNTVVEKEGGLSVFDTDIRNLFFFFATAEITAQLTGKIGAHLPAAEGLSHSRQ